MSAVLLVGTGAVGLRAARQLADTPEIDRLLVSSRNPERAAGLVEAMGERAVVHRAATGGLPEIPADVAGVAVAAEAPEAYRWVRAALDHGVPVATVVDDGFGELAAAATTVPVVTGCGLGPGLTDVLARHAADAFDVVGEVHVARVGAAGPACVEATVAARRETPGEWREGVWRVDRACGPELLWFPEPLGARECQLVRTGVAACVAAIPGARHVTSRLGVPPTAGRFRRGLGRDPKDQGWGAARVEVSGWRDGVAGSIVYGVVDRTAVASGVVLAVTAAALAGAVDAGVATVGGLHALGEVCRPVPFLTELARRGVKAAAFEGVEPR